LVCQWADAAALPVKDDMRLIWQVSNGSIHAHFGTSIYITLLAETVSACLTCDFWRYDKGAQKDGAN
jgi:hypothetical protein